MGTTVTVTNANGSPIGDGPLTNIVSYQHTARLSAAGEVALSIPVADPRRNLLYRYARMQIETDYGRGGRRHSSIGIVERTERSGGTGGTLVASGGDLLRELDFISAAGLVIREFGDAVPSDVQIVNPNGGGYSVPEAIDGNPATGHSVTLGADAWLYVLRPYRFSKIIFTGAGTAGAPARLQGFVSGDGWLDVTIVSDSTNGLTQDGEIEWEPLQNETQAAHGNDDMFAMRFVWLDSTGPNTTINEIGCFGIIPTTSGFAQLLALAPGWALSEDWHGSTSEAVVMECGNNSLLWAACELSKRTNDQWRLADGGVREIELLRSDRPESGITAVNWSPSVASTNPDVCIIENIRQIEDYSDDMTRIYPYGAGSGDGRLTLAAATLELPLGYAMNSAANYIERVLPAGEQRIDREVVFREIAPVDGALASADKIGADQLALAALAHLRLRDGSTTYVAYDLIVAGAHRKFRPGETIRVAMRDGAIDIDAHLHIIEASESVIGDEVVSTRLVVATLPRAPLSEADVIVAKLAELTASSGYAQPLPLASLQGQLRGSDIVEQIVTNAGGRPGVRADEAVDIAAALAALGLVYIR